jgi:hypothetical protein
MTTAAAAERDLTCKAVMWIHEGLQLSYDERHAFRYEVRERGSLIGFITTDRARSHPDVKWKCSRLRDGKIEPDGCYRSEELDGEYRTIEEALGAF